MHWVRSRVQLGSWAALFALAVQLALSFGHLHVNRLQAGPVLASRVLQFAIQPSADRTFPLAAPEKHHPATLVDDFCAICALMKLVGLSTEPPILVLPSAIHQIESGVPTELASVAAQSQFFRARAPPET